MNENFVQWAYYIIVYVAPTKLRKFGAQSPVEYLSICRTRDRCLVLFIYLKAQANCSYIQTLYCT